MMVEKLLEITSKLNINFVYKTSFDKANRTSLSSERGIGIENSIEVFDRLKNEFKINILTDIHIEARGNWDDKNIPDGTPLGGFVPYLNINATITNERTGQKTFVDLTPHLNLIDNFHYARNISLPGNVNDYYNVVFNINPPEKLTLSFHKDWNDSYSNQLFKPTSFEYNNIDFKEIANSSRR